MYRVEEISRRVNIFPLLTLFKVKKLVGKKKKEKDVREQIIFPYPFSLQRTEPRARNITKRMKIPCLRIIYDKIPFSVVERARETFLSSFFWLAEATGHRWPGNFLAPYAKIDERPAKSDQALIPSKNATFLDFRWRWLVWKTRYYLDKQRRIRRNRLPTRGKNLCTYIYAVRCSVRLWCLNVISQYSIEILFHCTRGTREMVQHFASLKLQDASQLFPPLLSSCFAIRKSRSPFSWNIG